MPREPGNLGASIRARLLERARAAACAGTVHFFQYRRAVIRRQRIELTIPGLNQLSASARHSPLSIIEKTQIGHYDARNG